MNTLNYSMLSKGIRIRNSKPSDHEIIVNVLKDWWNGRDLSSMLPKLFLVHFTNTSFVLEKNNQLIGFLIGFLSPATSNEGYIHFAGVHPDYRYIGIGKMLYDCFFNLCKENNRTIIRACTSPVNKGSIKFHKNLGFSIVNGNAEVDGIQVTLDYNKPDDHKVLFEIKI
ncbi:GNAT family N-acetyltransferase [Desulfobacterales bacterium HSG17]|nr:GNAT family N-acetyltransferase [Desulfobacterales bacterium HSG17]